MVEESHELGMKRLKGFRVTLSRGKSKSKYLIFNILQLLAQNLKAILYKLLEVRPKGKPFLLFQILQEIQRQRLHLSPNSIALREVDQSNNLNDLISYHFQHIRT